MIEKPQDDAAHRPAARTRGPWYRRGLWWKLPLLGAVLVIGWMVLEVYRPQREFNRRVAVLQSQGEPISALDWLRERDGPLVDSQVMDVRHVGRYRGRDDPSGEAVMVFLYNTYDAFFPPLSARHRELGVRFFFRDIEATGLHKLETLHERRNQDWPSRGTGYDDHEFAPHGLRESMVILAAAASLALDGDDQARGLRRVDQLSVLAALGSRHPTLKGYYAFNETLRHQADLLIAYAPSLRFETRSEGVTTDRLRELIRRLLDDAEPRRGLWEGVRFERAHRVDVIRALPSTMGLKDSVLLAAAVPSAGIGILDQFQRLLGQLNHPDWPAASTIAAALDAEVAGLGGHVGAIITDNVPNVTRLLIAHHQLLTTRRMAAVALAVRLYRLDHDDAYPPSLDALVPRYLPAVPEDAMSAGQPIRYDAARRVLWSVGADMIDNNADAGGELMSRGSWRSPDFVVPLYAIELDPESPAEGE